MLTIKDYIQDIQFSIDNARGDFSAVDFIEMGNEVISIIQKEIEEAQEEIDKDVNKRIETIEDDFGGGISLRELKGE